MNPALEIRTPFSLLQRLSSSHDDADWRRFVQIYTPLLFAYARRLGLDAEPAADLVQDVFLVLVKELPRFDYDAQRSFRGWLWTVFSNKYRERCRHFDPLASAARPGMDGLVGSDMVTEWVEADYRRHVIGRAVELMRSEFPETTWKAYWEYAVEGRPPAEVAAELGVSVVAVYQAKSRVLRRLRQELDQMLE